MGKFSKFTVAGPKNQTVGSEGNKRDLAGAKILLVVGGSIAAYKSCQLARRLVSAGAEVRALLTASGATFIQPLTLEYITGRAVVANRFEGEDGANVDHIALARWPDLIVIAPASANRISRLALGLADDMLGAALLATTAPIILAPAMNHQMWRQPAVQRHLQDLRERGCSVAEPGTGEHACGEFGPGRMMEVEELMPLITGVHQERAPAAAAVAAAAAAKRRPLRCLMTMGATIEDIDPVRFISNRSSGRMGLALYDALTAAGVDTRVVCGSISAEVSWASPSQGRAPGWTAVRSAEEMRANVLEQAGEHRPDLFIGVAAVCDYRAKSVQPDKIASGDDRLALELEPNPDIIAEVKRGFPDVYCVAFAAQTGDLRAKGLAKLEGKRVDMVVANPVAGSDSSIGGTHTSGLILRAGSEIEFARMSKADFAALLVEEILAAKESGLPSTAKPAQADGSPVPSSAPAQNSKRCG